MHKKLWIIAIILHIFVTIITFSNSGNSHTITGLLSLIIMIISGRAYYTATGKIGASIFAGFLSVPAFLGTIIMVVLLFMYRNKPEHIKTYKL